MPSNIIRYFSHRGSSKQQWLQDESPLQNLDSWCGSHLWWPLACYTSKALMGCSRKPSPLGIKHSHLLQMDLPSPQNSGVRTAPGRYQVPAHHRHGDHPSRHSRDCRRSLLIGVSPPAACLSATSGGILLRRKCCFLGTGSNLFPMQFTLHHIDERADLMPGYATAYDMYHSTKGVPSEIVAQKTCV